MRLIQIIFSFFLFTVQVNSQVSQPTYLGEAIWKKVPNQKEKELLPVITQSYPITKKVSVNNKLTVTQAPINPESITLHNGPTKPIIEKIIFTGKKLGVPQSIEAVPLQTRDNAQFNISYTDKQHGFAGTNSTSFAEDDEHNIWIASGTGLIKYDGYHYYLYNQKNGLPDLRDLSLVYDDQKRLWLASDNGAYYLKNDSLFSFQSPEINFSNIPCVKVQIDRLKRIWLSTKKNGAICIDGTNIEIYDKRCGLTHDYVQSTHLDKKGKLFLGFQSLGIIVIEQNKMRLLFSTSKNMKVHSFLSFYEDEEGIWAGGYLSGLMRMGVKDTIQYSISGKFDERIFDIKKAPGGLWLACYSQSLCYFNKNNLIRMNETNGLLNRFPFALYEDSFQNLWVSSLQSGFSRINENSFYVQHYANPAISNVRIVLPDNKNGHWIFTEGKGLIYQKNNLATTYSYKTNIGIEPFLYANDGVINNDGTLWMGSYGPGIIKVNENNFISYVFSNFSDNSIVNSIKIDAANQVWFSPTKFGLIVYDNSKFWRYTEKSGLLSNEVINLFLDADKKIHWTFPNGYQRLSATGIETFFIGNHVFSYQINGMVSLSADTTLLATNTNGLILVIKKKAYQFTTANGLSSNMIKTIIKDSLGKIWISTEKSIESFRLSGVSIFEHTIFDESNGSYILEAQNVLLDTTGLPYWNTGENKLVYNPEFLHKKKNKPNFSFAQIELDDQFVSLQEPISMLPNQHIKLTYKTIYWGRENHLKLKYLLISNENDTTERMVQNNGSILISEILPGTYRIILKAIDNNDYYFSNAISFTVNNYWYNTWFFRTIMACLLISGIVIFFWQKGKGQTAINHLLQIKVAEQTKEIMKEKEELSSSYLVINKQNSEKDILIKEINHRVKNNLQFISAMVEMQMGSDFKKDTVESLLGTARRLKAMSLVHEMLYNHKDTQGLSIKKYIIELIDNLKEIAIDNKHPIQFKIEVEDFILDSKTAIPLGMIISELVSNSLKHAFTGIALPEVTIQLLQESATDNLHLIVKDNGVGMPTQIQSFNGLGTRLIDIFSRQLEGEYTIHYQDHFVYELYFKQPLT